MNKTQFLTNLFDILRGYTFDIVENTQYGTFYISNTDNSQYWNLFLVNQPCNEAHLVEIEKRFLYYKRTPSIYFSTESYQEELQTYLLLRKYSLSHKDSFMFHDGLNIPAHHNKQIKQVTSEKSLDEFIDTANKCYVKNDPQGPYGELHQFVATMRGAWHNLSPKDKIALYTTYNDQGDAVAVSILSSGNNIGYITTVGSLPSVRGEGYGKHATYHCLQESVKRGNKYHCLATEKDTYPYEFYKRLGFKNEFTSVCYVSASITRITASSADMIARPIPIPGNES